MLGIAALWSCASPATQAQVHLVEHRWTRGQPASFVAQAKLGALPSETETSPPLDCVQAHMIDGNDTVHPLNLVSTRTAKGSHWTRLSLQTATSIATPAVRLHVASHCEHAAFEQDLEVRGGDTSTHHASLSADADTPSPTERLDRWLRPWMVELETLRGDSRRERAELELLRRRLQLREEQTWIYGAAGLLITLLALLGGLVTGLRSRGHTPSFWTSTSHTPKADPAIVSLSTPRAATEPAPTAPPPSSLIMDMAPASRPSTQGLPLLETQRPLRLLNRIHALQQEDRLGEAALALEEALHARQEKSAWLLLELLDVYTRLDMTDAHDMVRAQTEAIFAVDLPPHGSDTRLHAHSNVTATFAPTIQECERLLLAGHADGRRLSVAEFRRALQIYADPPTDTLAIDWTEATELHS